MEIDEVAEMMVALFGDQPCNWDGMDDLTDEWCAVNCGNCDVAECWKHAITERWWEKIDG